MNNNLTQMELEVLKLVAYGINNKEISDRLSISIHTTKSYLESIYRKMNVHNKVQAIVYAISKGLIVID